MSRLTSTLWRLSFWEFPVLNARLSPTGSPVSFSVHFWQLYIDEYRVCKLRCMWLSLTWKGWDFSITHLFILLSKTPLSLILSLMWVWVGVGVFTLFSGLSETLIILKRNQNLVPRDLITISLVWCSQSTYVRSDSDSAFAFHLKSSQKEPKRIQKTMSSGDLGKMDSLRKSMSHTDSRSEEVHSLMKTVAKYVLWQPFFPRTETKWRWDNIIYHELWLYNHAIFCWKKMRVKCS